MRLAPDLLVQGLVLASVVKCHAERDRLHSLGQNEDVATPVL